MYHFSLKYEKYWIRMQLHRFWGGGADSTLGNRMTEKDHRLGAKWGKSRKVSHAVDNTWHCQVLGKVTHEAMYRETFKIWTKDSLLRKCLRAMDRHSGSEGYPLGKSCLEATQKDSWCGDEMVKDVSWHFLHLTNCSTSQMHKYVFSLNVFLYQRGHHLDTYCSLSVGLARSHVSIWMPQVWESGELATVCTAVTLRKERRWHWKVRMCIWATVIAIVIFHFWILILELWALYFMNCW